MQLNIQPLTPESAFFYANHNYNYEGDCGYDLGLAEDTKVYYKATTKINLQVVITAWDTVADMTEDSCVDFLIAPRSCITDTSLRLANCIGVIDKNYRGSLKIALDYHDLRTERQLPLLTEMETGFQYSVLRKGERLVQIIAPVFRTIGSKNLVTEHDATVRGDKGFGSTNNRKKV